MPDDGASALNVDDVLITELLASRPSRLSDYEGESGALAALAQEMARNPSGVLHKVADFARTLCGADSAGVSVFERDGGEPVVRWCAVSGAYAAHLNRALPRDACACGTVAERNALLLFERPGRCFAPYHTIEPAIDEALHVPWIVDGEVAGTVWALTHAAAPGADLDAAPAPAKHFDAEDARLLQDLASCACAAHRMTRALRDAQNAGENLAAQVAARTRSLQDVNARLRDESKHRREAETALHESEARLQAAVSIDTVGVLFFNLDGTMADANEAFEQMSGYSRADLRAAARAQPARERGRDAQREARSRTRVPLDALGVTTRAVNDLATAGRTQPYERELVRRDGTHWWGLFAPTRLSGAGMESKCAEFVLDITERRRVETECLESEERFRALVEGFAQAVWETDAQGLAERPSASWSAYTGQPADEWFGDGWFHAVHPEDRALAMENWKESVATQRVVNAEFRLQIATGGWRWTNLRAAPLWNADGSVRKWVGMNIDIDDRHTAQEALRESEARFRALADASPALIWQIDTLGNTVYLNQRYLAAIGLTPDELLLTAWHAIVHPLDLPSFLASLQAAQREQSAFQSRIRIKVKDESWHWFETGCAPWFSANGEYRGHVGVSIDITEAVRAEDALKEADRRKDEFLATLAHELRNPLAPIANAMHLLRRHDVSADSRPILEMLDRQVHHMVRLIDDLMEVSRITRGKIGLVKAPVALAEIVGNALETSRPAIDQAGHALTVSMPEAPLMLNADSTRLTQVFTNLLNNAARYTDKSGRIHLSARRDGDWAVIALRDTGIGMSAEQIDKAFEMFAQLQRSAMRSPSGLGIGLTMVRHLVRMHGGTVEAASAGPGKGSEFTVRLPLLREESVSRAETASGRASRPGPGEPLAGKRILVVDDNRDAADSLAMVLQSEGADVHVAYDGASALAALEAAAPQALPQAIVLDIGMPGMDGYAIARHIRQSRRFGGVFIVALTGWGQHADRLRSRMSGIDSHLTKPVDFRTLLDLLIAH
ncbi:PAS domain S-box protein [Paraburkholderia sp. J41]|uniref:PAS domain S-box protein n=1 Tax=Paraburkholderia sp. J41 TaxID=2805433 RepID=UPI002AC31F6F|nr:PAS domain S-box protein [Paraburkholderia sp. J41]